MKKSHSITRSFLILYALITAFLFSGISYLVFSHWYDSIIQITTATSENLNRETIEKIESFIQSPMSIRDISVKSFNMGIIDFTAEKPREKFFSGLMSTFPEAVYSFALATPDGAYYGARRTGDSKIEIMKNDIQTHGESWYFDLNKTFTAGKMVFNAGKFDPRSRDWYKNAVQLGGFSFSPVYRHFVMNDLTVTASWPVYTQNNALAGVFQVSMTLSSIGKTLSSFSGRYNGFVSITERNTGYLIANSLGVKNFTVNQQSDIERKTSKDLGIAGFSKAYHNYSVSGQQKQLISDSKGKLFIFFQNYRLPGLDWVVFSAVPELPFSAALFYNIRVTIAFIILTVIFSILIFFLLSKWQFEPMKSLLAAAQEFSNGALNRRAPVVHNDEIGKLAAAFNNVADSMQTLVNNLEKTVTERTEDLQKTNESLEEHRKQLRLILDTTAEGIFGIGEDGRCSFCNQSGLKLLGYSDANEVIGCSLKKLLYKNRQDSDRQAQLEQLITYFASGPAGRPAEDIFFRTDGTPFDVEYRAVPEYRNGRQIGYIVSFLDCTEQKEEAAKIKFIGSHDEMTGLVNRRTFDAALTELDTPENQPVSILYADLNGLKLINDIFGHLAGDELIKKAGTALQVNCGNHCIAARVGGDEFCVLLPKTPLSEAQQIARNLTNDFSHQKINSIPCSIAVGTAARMADDEPIERIIESAEAGMYQDKSLFRKHFESETITSIIQTLHQRSIREKIHSENVSILCGQIGSLLHLPETECKKLRDAGYYHDIGKITLSDELLIQDSTTCSEAETYLYRQHPVIGYRILNATEETLDLASAVYAHHECWNGTGYPKKLKGEEIPLISRIISVAERYERARYAETSGLTAVKAVQLLKDGSGTLFDPEIVSCFVSGLKQNS